MNKYDKRYILNKLEDMYAIFDELIELIDGIEEETENDED